ncbi:putative GMC oxidoreductase [Xylariaceae sp. FL0662B]|nr:putative GMC oxidoreductase [Xylariaceae sp. FL0662B]
MKWQSYILLLFGLGTVVVSRSFEYYDAVVVGGGPAGLVMASRLSENPDVKVLLLENGPETYLNEDIMTPRYASRLQGSAFSWNFTSIPQPTLDGAAPSLAQGNGLGGGTAINIMAYCRGSASVFDEWANISGIDELRWENLVDYFEMSTNLFVPSDRNYQQIIDTTYYGRDHVNVSYESSGQRVAVDAAFVDTWVANGAQDADLTSGEGIGMIVGGPHSVTHPESTRSYAYPAYGLQLAARSNVELLHSSRVTKINFDGKKAVGVDFVDLLNNETHSILSKETIISAGAINSPRLLLLSGIGPKDHLTEVGIRTVVDSPEVGSNFFDHHYTVMMFNATPDIITSLQLGDPATLAEFLAEYKANGTGPLSTPGGSSFFAERLSDDLLDSLGVNVSFPKSLPADRPHLLYQYTSAAMLPAPDDANAVSVFAALVQPEAPGTVRLNSSDWRDDPLLDTNYFGSESDMAIALYGYKRLLTMMRSDTMKSVRVNEIYPGMNVSSDEDIKAALNQAARSFHHPAGACSLGRVLDQSFRVKGVENLRVVDSSAIPSLPTCHLQSSTYAVAEVAAAILKKEMNI